MGEVTVADIIGDARGEEMASDRLELLFEGGDVVEVLVRLEVLSVI